MLTVIAGGMFSEKSTELQRRGKRLIRAGKKVLFIKPEFDNRYSENEIVTHDDKRVSAVNVPIDYPEMLLTSMTEDIDVILIDEIQFFMSGVVEVIRELLKKDKTVIVAGLDLDFEAKPFYVTGDLMCIAENVVKLNAVCSECGDDSWVSYKEPNGQRIQLGTNEYKPMCRKCFEYKKSLEAK